LVRIKIKFLSHFSIWKKEGSMKPFERIKRSSKQKKTIINVLDIFFAPISGLCYLLGSSTYSTLMTLFAKGLPVLLQKKMK
jgi:hypothetical protein